MTNSNDVTPSAPGGAARASAGRRLSRLLARIFHVFKGLAPVVIAMGCRGEPRPSAAPLRGVVASTWLAAVARASAELPPARPPTGASDGGAAAGPADEPGAEAPRRLGTFHMTFYYVIGEDEVGGRAAAPVAVAPTPANDNAPAQVEDAAPTLAAVAPPSAVTLFRGGGGCAPIARVSREFAAEIEMQGTGKLHDGRVVNIWGACGCAHSPCFSVVGTPWGTSGSGRALTPFRTVAVDPRVVPVGTLLYVPALEGRRMPGRTPWGGFLHDGCVVADDTGGAIDGTQLDLFVGRKSYYFGLANHGGSHGWARQAEVFDGAAICQRKGRVVTRVPAAI